ncbi:unnamed protein product [Durusdinium trenchii]|uniref:Testicular haploid expressed gene protein-like n=1 Tax=Durusdinium trenchii TaxID=1381693 RepID=A0ABP0IMK4_9DINO
MANQAKRRKGSLRGNPGVWWTKFGVASMDFSAQEKTHPSDTIFKNVVERKTWDPAAMSRAPPARLKPAPQMRHPAPAKEAMAPPKAPPDLEKKHWAHEVTQRQGALWQAEMRQRRIDSWAFEAPIRQVPSTSKLTEMWADASFRPSPVSPKLSEATRREMSLSALSCAQASREVYKRNGYVLGRTPAPLRSKSLSLQSVLFAGEVVKTSPDKFRRPRKYDMAWKVIPDKRFVFDPKTFLPVPRGGWDMNDPSWPDIVPAGARTFKPLTFESKSQDEASHGSTA